METAMRRWFTCVGVCVLGLAAVFATPDRAAGGEDGQAASSPLRSISVVGPRFEVTTATGNLLPQDVLVGAVLSYADGSGGTVPVRIDRVMPDPKKPGWRHPALRLFDFGRRRRVARFLRSRS
jgi:hypothetical protein